MIPNYLDSTDRSIFSRNLATHDLLSLDQAEFNLKTPFLLKLAPDKQFIIHTISRLLPHRRMVCLASKVKEKSKEKTLSANDVFILKLFFRKDKYQQDFDKELNGYEQLASTELKLPKLFKPKDTFTHSKESQDFCFLRYQYLSEATNLGDFLNNEHTEIGQKNDYIKQMLVAIAQMHNHDLQQVDLHLNNFLIHRKQVYCLDFGDISTLKNKKQQIKNIANVLSQFSVFQENEIQNYFDIYNKNLDENHKLEKNELDKHISNWRSWRIKKYLQKAHRNCTEFKIKHYFKRYISMKRVYNKPEWQSLFNDIDSLIGQGKLLKDGNSSTVAMVELNEQKLLIKRYNIKSFGHLLTRFWRPSRAHISWDNAHRLEVLGIKTPKPIAMIENRLGPFRHSAYYISEFQDAKNILEVEQEQKGFNEEQMNLFVELFQALKQQKISHGDMKGTNLLLDNNDINLIDLDAMKQHKSDASFKKAFNKDKKRFLKNWGKELYQKFEEKLVKS